MIELEHQIVHIFLLLLAVHALADYPLQGEFVSRFKNPREKMGDKIVWPWILGSHAMMHAGGVLVVTGSATLAIAELVVHAATDALKCLGYFGFHTDQAIHIGCKVLWVVLLWTEVVQP